MSASLPARLLHSAPVIASLDQAAIAEAELEGLSLEHSVVEALKAAPMRLHGNAFGDLRPAEHRSYPTDRIARCEPRHALSERQHRCGRPMGRTEGRVCSSDQQDEQCNRECPTRPASARRGDDD